MLKAFGEKLVQICEVEPHPPAPKWSLNQPWWRTVMAWALEAMSARAAARRRAAVEITTRREAALLTRRGMNDPILVHALPGIPDLPWPNFVIGSYGVRLEPTEAAWPRLSLEHRLQ